MAGKLFSWAFRQNPPPTAPPPPTATMAQPSQRKLWCAFSDRLNGIFSIDCTLNVDTIEDVKKKIREKRDAFKTEYIEDWDLYSPVSKVEAAFTPANGQFLPPPQRITSDFPQSNDPFIQIVVIRAQVQQPTPANEGRFPHLKRLCHGHS